MDDGECAWGTVAGREGGGGIIPSEYMTNVVIWLKLTVGTSGAWRAGACMWVTASSITSSPLQSAISPSSYWKTEHQATGKTSSVEDKTFPFQLLKKNCDSIKRCVQRIQPEKERGCWTTWLTARKERGDPTARVSDETCWKRGVCARVCGRLFGTLAWELLMCLSVEGWGNMSLQGGAVKYCSIVWEKLLSVGGFVLNCCVTV